MTSVRSTKYERILNGRYGFVDEIYFSQCEEKAMILVDK